MPSSSSALGVDCISALVRASEGAFASELSTRNKETSRVLHAEAEYVGAENERREAHAIVEVRASGRALDGFGRIVDMRDALIEPRPSSLL